MIKTLQGVVNALSLQVLEYTSELALQCFDREKWRRFKVEHSSRLHAGTGPLKYVQEDAGRAKILEDCSSLCGVDGSKGIGLSQALLLQPAECGSTRLPWMRSGQLAA